MRNNKYLKLVNIDKDVVIYSIYHYDLLILLFLLLIFS